MFGGLAFLCHGRMCYGIVGTDLMIRVTDDELDAVIRRRHVRPMDFTGRPLRGDGRFKCRHALEGAATNPSCRDGPNGLLYVLTAEDQGALLRIEPR